MTSTIHRRLREETRPQHERLEARADILARIGSRAGRRDVVVRFHRLHADIEAAAAPWVGGLDGLDYEARRRTAQLDRDLQDLGVQPLATGRRTTPRAESLGEALGLIYVLEGSTLGGQVIRRAALAGGGDLVGLSFLDPYGPLTGERWRAFLSVIDVETRCDRAGDAMVRGARAGFEHAEHRLCGAEPGTTRHGR